MNYRRNASRAKNGLRVLLLAAAVLSAFIHAPAQNKTLKEHVKAGTSPDAFVESLRKRSGGKWNEVDEVSAPMAQILQVTTDAVGEKTNAGTDCQRAAAVAAYEVVFDAYSTVPLIGFERAIGEAIKKIISLYGSKMKEAADGGKDAVEEFKEKLKEGKEKIDEYLKELKTKGKPEVYVSQKKKGGCSIVTVAIWDRAAESYDVTIYGDCKCSDRSTGTIRKSIKLGTFAVHFTGRVTVGVDYRKESPVLNVSVPTESVVEANCEVCTGTAKTTPQEQPPVETFDPCSLKPPCPECGYVTDKIKTACERMQALESERRDRAGEFQGRQNTKKYVQDELSRLQTANGNADKIREKQAELKQIDREIRAIEIIGYSLGLEELELKNQLRKLADELKQCEKAKCGTKAKAAPVKTKGDPCLLGKWVSESSDTATLSAFLANVNTNGIVFEVNADGTASFDFSGTKAIVTRSAFGGGDATITTTIRGKVTAKLHIEDKYLGADGEVRSTAKITETSSDGSEPRVVNFDVFLLQGAQIIGYKCAGDSLTLEYTPALKFKRK